MNFQEYIMDDIMDDNIGHTKSLKLIEEIYQI